MLVHASTKTHKSVSLNVLTPHEIKSMKPIFTDRLYLVLSVKSEFETLKYPLPLSPNPLTSEELTDLCEKLYDENTALRQQITEHAQNRSIDNLERQIYSLNESLEEVRYKKDQEIFQLQKKLKLLKKKSQTPKKSPYYFYERLNSAKSPRMLHKETNSPPSQKKSQTSKP